MSIGRLKEMSAIVVTGGVMEATVVKPEYVEMIRAVRSMSF